MSKILLKALLVSPAIVGATLAVSTAAFAASEKATSPVAQAIAPQTQVLTAQPEVAKTELAPVFSNKATVPTTIAQTAPAPLAQAAPVDTDSIEQLNRYGREGRGSQKKDDMSQVTSVSQLSDVRPTDWAFQALQSLVERYGCIVGYPDRTYRGNQALTRYEFAAGLNSCLDRVNELIAAGTADLVRKEDLAVLQRLQEEFAAELATLRGRVDSLEARATTLEKQQFSTTTKLAGEVIFAVTDELRQPTDNNPVFQNRVRLALNTSFTGKDLLVTRIAAGNAGAGTSGFSFPGAPGYGSEGIQTFNFGFTDNNAAFIDWVAYFFPIGNNINVYIPAVSGLHYDYVPTNSGLMEAFDGGTGPLSIFAQRNPIYLIGGGSGLGVNFGVTSAIKLSLGYLADNSDGSQVTFAANNPTASNGLFGGSYSALAQLTFSPSEALSVGLTYVRAYRRAAIFDGGSGLSSSGTLYANTGDPIGFSPTTFGTTVNAYGISGALKLSRNLSINAFGSYITADDLGDGLPEGEIWTYGAGLAIADFGKKGNLLGIMAGVEPYLGNPRQFGASTNRRDLPIHLEAFYKYQLNDNISITPGAIYIINPGQDRDNRDVLIGTLRTTFTF
ncbi:MAG TPA: iron uptake porin [Thermosynechococcaceae cyanobacterium]